MSKLRHAELARRAARLRRILREGARRLAGEESGQSVVLAALCMLVLIGLVGIAIVGGQLRYQKRRFQAAAVAGALELSVCGSSTNCPAMPTAAQNALTENGLTGSSLPANCVARMGTKLELTVSNPSCAVASGPNNGNSAYVEAIVSEPVPTVVARVPGVNSVPMLGRAETAAVGGGECIYALDPSSSGAITVDAFAAINTTCGIGDESNVSSPSASTGANMLSVPDPFASLPKPTIPACGTSTNTPFHGSNRVVSISSRATAVLYPHYACCDGMIVAQGANFTFEPGTYVIESKNGSNGLSVDVGATVWGTGVTFYNCGQAGNIVFSGNSSDNVSFTAGTYSGVLFSQDPQDTAGAIIQGSPSSRTVLQGSYHFPTAKVTLAYSGNVDGDILVAYNIEFTLCTVGTHNTGSSFTSNYSSIANGSPVGGTNAVVIQ